MGLPQPIATSLVVYGLIGVCGILIVSVMGLTGKLTKDDVGVGNTVVVISTFATWLFWCCAWMHQWHPLIVPEYEE